MSDYAFCSTYEDRVFLRNQLAYALWDAFPITHELLHKPSELIKFDDQSVKGFNIGGNVGAIAGQTIFHCHFHLIPPEER